MTKTDLTIAGPLPDHPLRGAGHRAVPIAVVILIGWLAYLGWPGAEIVPLVALLVPAAAAGGRS